MTYRSRLSLLTSSLFVLAPFGTIAFAPGVNLHRTRLSPVTVRGLKMKNMFTDEEKVSSLDSLLNKFSSSSNKLDRAQSSDSSVVDAQGEWMKRLFEKKDSIQESDYMAQQGPTDMATTTTTNALAVGAAVILGAALVASTTMDIGIPSPSEFVAGAGNLFQDPNAFLQDVVQNVESMGPTGILYFGLFYTLAEVLGIPALPLTASAGYLFGLVKGTAVVLTAASVAAAFAFVIGRTFLRSYVEGLLENYPEFQKLDTAIGKEGFKLMILLRLSPIFPFSLSNYLYGASSVGFWQYFCGTLLGFFPGTLAYVYSGEIGKTLTSSAGGTDVQPWYIYAGGMALVIGLLKLAADVANGAIQELEEEEA